MSLRATEILRPLWKRGSGKWRAAPSWLRFLAGVAAAYVIWRHRSWALHDAILWAGVLYAAARFPAGWSAWRSVPGCLGLLWFGWILVQAPFGTHPMVGFRDMAKHADSAFFALAIPAVMRTRSAVWTAVACSACAFTLVLGADLVRLAAALGPDLLEKAHTHEPFVWTHSNIAAMAAGMAAIVWLHLAWLMRGRRWLAAGAAGGLLVNLAYLVVIGSRGPQAAFVGALLLVMVATARGWRRKLTMVALAAAMGLALLAFGARINPRFAQAVSPAGLVDRDKVWKHTWDLVKERPLIGHGFGEKVFMLDYHTESAPPSPHRFHHPHQYFLGAWFAYGAIGLTLLVALWSSLAFRLLRVNATTGASSQRSLTCALLTLLAFIHIFSLADSPSNVTALAMLWLVPACLVATQREDAA